MLTKEQQESFYKKLGELIRSARKKNKVKQEVLSKEVNLSRISIVHIEQGSNRVQLHTLVQIAKSLNVDIKELIPPIESTQQSITPELIKKIEEEGLKEDSKEKLAAIVSISANANK